MPTVTLSGASDDLIVLDGDIREEFNYLRNDESEGALVAFSDGTVLRIQFSSMGVWRISPVSRGAAELAIDQAPEDDDGGTDVAALTGDVRWAVHGIAWAKAAGASS